MPTISEKRANGEGWTTSDSLSGGPPGASAALSLSSFVLLNSEFSAAMIESGGSWGLCGFVPSSVFLVAQREWQVNFPRALDKGVELSIVKQADLPSPGEPQRLGLLTQHAALCLSAGQQPITDAARMQSLAWGSCA